VTLDAKIAKIVEANGAEFYDTEIVKDSGNSIFRVYITKDGGVTLNLCADISNELSPFLDIHPPIDGTYFLEVSSPGIERKLKKPRHFISAIGENIKFKICGGKKEKGRVISADENGFTVKIKGETQYFGYSDVSKVRTYYEWN